MKNYQEMKYRKQLALVQAKQIQKTREQAKEWLKSQAAKNMGKTYPIFNYSTKQQAGVMCECGRNFCTKHFPKCPSCLQRIAKNKIQKIDVQSKSQITEAKTDNIQKDKNQRNQEQIEFTNELKSLGFSSETISKLIVQKIQTMELLILLTEDDLKELKIPMGERLKIRQMKMK